MNATASTAALRTARQHIRGARDYAEAIPASGQRRADLRLVVEHLSTADELLTDLLAPPPPDGFTDADVAEVFGEETGGPARSWSCRRDKAPDLDALEETPDYDPEGR